MIVDLINSGAEPSKVIGIWLCGLILGLVIGSFMGSRKRGDR